MPAQRTYAQGKYWLLTIGHHLFTPWMPSGVVYIKGQLETGDNTGYLHWQVTVCFEKKVRVGYIKEKFGTSVHCVLTNSKKALDYVFKDETAVPNTRFELGKLPLNRNSKADWEQIWAAAKEGKIDEIPADVRVRSYTSLKRIEKDYMRPEPIERKVRVFVGPTGTGKSRRAWDEAGLDAYPKDPCSKFWDGYSGQQNVVIDEFRGQIGISHVLRWFDRYPVCIETKGSGSVLRAKNIWITSNLPPAEWYADLDAQTQAALMRRLEIEEMLVPFYEDLE